MSSTGCRLLYIVGDLVQGGLEQQLWYLLDSIDRERYGPAVLVWHYNPSDRFVPRFRSLGVPLYRFRDGLSRAGKLSATRALVARLRPEIIHSYNFYTNFGAEWGARGSRAIPVGSIRRDYVTETCEAGRWLGRLSARWPRTQICNSRSAAEAVRREMAATRPKHLIVIRNGLDLRRFPVTVLQEDGPQTIVGIGALEPLKRWDRLLNAAATLRRAGMDFRVRLVGDGSCRSTLEMRTRELGLDNVVTLDGYHDDVSALLQQASILVHTSDAEGCPNVVMEAMASGRAVVATDAGDVPDLVDHARTGFVVHRGDDDALATSIGRMLADRDACRRMGEAGRAKAEQEFGMARLVDELFGAYAAAGWQGAAAAC